MKNIKIDVEKIQQSFKTADANTKKELIALFGDQITLSDNIMDRVTSFEDACEVLGISTEVPGVSGIVSKHQKAMIAIYKLMIICQALNEGWEPNWADTNESKYYSWFYFERNGAAAGFGCSNAFYAPSSALAYIGSRLLFKNRDLAVYFGKNFNELWREYLLIEK